MSKNARELTTSAPPVRASEAPSRRELIKALLGAVGAGTLAGCNTLEVAPIADMDDMGCVDTVLGSPPGKNRSGDLATKDNVAVGAQCVVAHSCLSGKVGGGGVFVWATGVDDGGTFIVPVKDGIVPPGIQNGWRRIYSGPIDVTWFGAVGDGIPNDAPAIMNAVRAARKQEKVYLKAGSYRLDSGIDLQGADWLIGDGKDKTRLNYLGADSAIKAAGWSGTICGVTVSVAQPTANGIEVGAGSRNCRIQDVVLDATLAWEGGKRSSGAGFFLNSGDAWSGGIEISTSVSTQFKFGVKMIGVSQAHSWTTVSLYNVWLAGHLPPEPASSGVLMNKNTNGIGTCMYGGTIEGFDVAINVEDGSYGGVFEVDIEANNNRFVVGNNFNGRIVQAQGKPIFSQVTNGPGTNVFRFLESYYLRTIESRFAESHVIYEGSGQLQEVVWYRNDSIIVGNPAVGAVADKKGLLAHARKFAIGLGQTGFYGPSVHPYDHYIEIGGQKILWANAAPMAGAWKRGDICYNLLPAAGGHVGWVCTADGSPGTWNAFGPIL